jgi:hypothetical protein
MVMVFRVGPENPNYEKDFRVCMYNIWRIPGPKKFREKEQVNDTEKLLNRTRFPLTSMKLLNLFRLILPFILPQNPLKSWHINFSES